MSTTVTGASGTTYITGTGSSGFDSAGLISVAVKAKMAPAYRLDDQIDVLETQSSAWNEALTDLTALSTASEALSATSDDSVFNDRTAYLSSSSVSDVDDVLAVTVDDDAELGIYKVKVISIAASHKVASDEIADKTSALGYSGSFTLSQASGTATAIPVTSDMTLADIASAINAQSSASGVTATLVKTSDAGYTLMLASADTGQSITAIDTSGGILEGLGILASDGSFANQLQAASLAEISIDGVTITSASNDIEDVLPGVSLSLYDDSAGGTITLEVGQDLSSVSDAITDFVDAYNTYRKLALLNQTTDSAGAVEGAVLFGDGLLRTTNSALFGALGTSVEIGGTTYTLANLGISYTDDNSLEIDSTKLEEMLIQHPDVVQAFFQQSVTSSSTALYVATTPGNLPSGDYTIDITTDVDGAITGATINGVALDVKNKTLTGAEGSIYEGLRLVYTGTGDTSVTLSVSTGLADHMMATLDTYTNETDGLITSKIDSIDGVIDDKQTKRDRIAEQADDYEEKLTAYYARIEAAIEASELALKQIQALFDSLSDDD